MHEKRPTKATRIIDITFPQVGYRNRGIGATINSRDTLVAFSVYIGLPERGGVDGLISCRNKRYNLSQRT